MNSSRNLFLNMEKFIFGMLTSTNSLDLVELDANNCERLGQRVITVND